jgi:competence protein ComEA
MRDQGDQAQAQTKNGIATLILFAILIVALVGGMLLLLASRPDPVSITINPPPPTATPAPSATPAPIRVYVTGAVAQPDQTLTLPYGSRVEDALNAVGGALPSADMARLNLAASLRDGDQIHVPAQNEAALELATPSVTQLIPINSATLEEIETLPEIGPATAQAIIDYREANGDFRNLDDLDQVYGIGPQLLETLAPLLSFD